MHLENGLQETRENKAFVYKTTAMATGCIRVGNDSKSWATVGINCCKNDGLYIALPNELSDCDVAVVTVADELKQAEAMKG